MEKEQAQIKVKDALEKMGCSEILFKDIEQGFYAAFNSAEVTSFVADVSGWSRSSTQLDLSGERQYKIEFKKVS